MDIYRLKITLKGIKPPIWRRIEVPSDHTLNDLHLMIQAAMGWYNCHLHAFRINGESYTEFFDENESPDKCDDKDFTLKQVLGDNVKKIVYEYDFGDFWEHDIVVESVEEANPTLKYPLCIAGKRACPPEDCGSIPGYYNCLEALEDSTNPGNEELLEWIGEFDPEEFDLEETNASLRSWRDMVALDY